MTPVENTSHFEEYDYRDNIYLEKKILINAIFTMVNKVESLVKFTGFLLPYHQLF